MKHRKYYSMLMFLTFFAGMLSLTGCQLEEEEEECLYCQGTRRCAECLGDGLLDNPPGAYCEYCKASGYCSRCIGSVITNRLENCDGDYCIGGVCSRCEGCGAMDSRGFGGHPAIYVPASRPTPGFTIFRAPCGICEGSGRCSKCRYGRRLIVKPKEPEPTQYEYEEEEVEEE